MTSPQPPKITITLDIDPPRFAKNDPTNRPTLYIAATSHAPQPITVFTWPSILNPQVALRRKNFYFLDLSDGRTPLFLEIAKIQRKPYQHVKGCGDDPLHFTLYPEKPLEFQSEFMPARRSGSREMTAGHKYLFGVNDGETIDWWREGTRDEVLGDVVPEDSHQHPPIRIENVRPVEVTVEE